MYLVEARQSEETSSREGGEAASITARWDEARYGCLLQHGKVCCHTARDWLLAMDFSQLNGGDLMSGPRWLRQRYEWGPSPWPMHWCEAVERKVIDCAVHAALAHEAFAARGLQCFRAQFIQLYNADAVAQWRTKWRNEQIPDPWIGDHFIYHEGNALLIGAHEVKLWDASAGWWIDPRQSGGYGSLAALRIFAEERLDGSTLMWGAHRVTPNKWQDIG